MTPMVKRLALVVVACGALHCESKTTRLIEQTTTDAPSSSFDATSADGRFVVSFPARALQDDSVVHIRTRRDLTAESLVSLVYEVTIEPPQALAAPATGRYLTLGADPTGMRMVRFEDVELEIVRVLADSAFDDAGVVATIDALPDVFAVNRRAQTGCGTFTCGARCPLCEGATHCTDLGYTSPDGACRADPNDCCVEDALLRQWDAAPTSGRFFVLDALEISSNVGFDLDGACERAGCIDNALAPLAMQGVALPVGPASLLLLELVGVPDAYIGDVPTVVGKFYDGVDADDDPDNDFSVPPGGVDCCRFDIAPGSLTGVPPQSRARAPGRITRGRLQSIAPVAFDVRRTDDATRLRIERALISARLPSDLATLDSGVIGGYLHARTLRSIPAQPSATLLDLAVLSGIQPDGDLDVDGLECLLDVDGDGRVDRCCDGNGDAPACEAGACLGAEVSPVDANDPGSCVWGSDMADGFSVGLTFTAVSAVVLGVAD